VPDGAGMSPDAAPGRQALLRAYSQYQVHW
jgi:hypothetical protein